MRQIGLGFALPCFRPYSSTGQVSLDALRGGTLVIIAGEGEQWTMTADYVAAEVAPLAVNSNGKTYGSEVFGENPDLVSEATINGRERYVRRTNSRSPCRHR